MSSTLYARAYKLAFMANDLSDRINEILDETGISPAKLARVADVSSTTVMLWRNGTTKEIKMSNAVPISRLYGYSAEWITTGQGPKFSSVKETRADYADDIPSFSRFIVDDPPPLKTVPLISWVQAGESELAIDLFQPGDADEWLICPVPHSDRTYALRVQGDSMTAPSGKSYPEGIDIFVDPEQRGGPGSGDLVIAKINGRDAVTFKQIAIEDGRMYLKPLNPKWDPIFEEFRVLGKVIYAGFKP